MVYSDDHIALAAEYALGTLDADERALVETMMIVDPGFLAMVEAWDRKLVPLHQMVAPVEPPADLWERIKLATARSEDHSPVVRPSGEEDSQPGPADLTNLKRAPEPIIDIRPAPREEPDQVEEKVALPPNPIVVRSHGGRVFGTFMTAVAACLAAVISLQVYRPDLLPQQLRIKPKVQVVEVKAPPPPTPAQLVAVLQSNAAAPAFILTVDTASRAYTVRRIGAPPEQNKSYELWIVSAKLGTPRSLGVIEADDFTTRKVLAAYAPSIVSNATYAVTLEPKGGSPSGAPTSQPLWAGKLFESVPAQSSNP